MEQSRLAHQGFSEVVNQPRFKAYQQRMQRSARVFLIIILVAVWLGFLGAAFLGKLDYALAVIQAMVVTGVAALFSLWQTLKGKKDQVWIGRIVDKQEELRKVRVHDSDGQNYVKKKHYVLYLKREDSERVFEQDLANQEALYNHYTVGERVKHHSGYTYLEKEKPGHEVVCIACGRLNRFELMDCQTCRLPLLK